MDYEIVHNCQVENLNEIYLKYFGYRDYGTFVEVGGYDGYNFSNTWGLAKAGWRGLYIEPNALSFSLCKKNHAEHNVKTLEIAAGNRTGFVEMLSAGPLTTYDKFYVQSETWKKEYVNSPIFIVPIEPLNDILISENIPEGFDLLVIDTEGSELEVLEGFSLWYWRPRMVIIESHEKSPYEELRHLVPAIDKYFSAYTKIYAGEVNSIYVTD